MTAVIDASALIEQILGSEHGSRVKKYLSQHAEQVHVPQLIFPETLSALHKLYRSRRMTAEHVQKMAHNLSYLPASRWSLEPLVPRAWAMHNMISVYDAFYVALAQVLNARLITTDARLARGVEANNLCAVDLA